MNRLSLDTPFREMIQASTNRTCQAGKDGTIYFHGDLYDYCPICLNQEGGGDDVAHYYPRRHNGGRWYPDNVAMLCRQIHQYIDTHESVKTAFFRSLLGDTRHDALVERMHRTFPYRKNHRAEMAKHFRSERNRMLALRSMGETGYIRAIPYD